MSETIDHNLVELSGLNLMNYGARRIHDYYSGEVGYADLTILETIHTSFLVCAFGEGSIR